MEEIKYLIFARGSGKGLREYAKIAEELNRQRDEAIKKELLKVHGIEKDHLMDIINHLREELPKLADIEKLREEPRREPTPEEIKRRLKYAKNPMEIRQLNRQLAKAYKQQRREKH